MRLSNIVGLRRAALRNAILHNLMGTAEFWLPVVVLCVVAFFAYANYLGVRQGEWRWWWVILSLLFLAIFIGILYPVYERATNRRKYGPHRSHLLQPELTNKQHNKALHPTAYSSIRSSLRFRRWVSLSLACRAVLDGRVMF